MWHSALISCTPSQDWALGVRYYGVKCRYVSLECYSIETVATIIGIFMTILLILM